MPLGTLCRTGFKNAPLINTIALGCLARWVPLVTPVLEKYFDISDFCTIADVVHISKNLGIKYIPPIVTLDASGMTDKTIVKKETLIDPISEKDGQLEKESFECAYLMIVNSPIVI